MLTLSVKIRKEVGKKVEALRKKGLLPAVLYGPKIKNQSLEVDLEEFERVYKEAGESTLVSLKVEGKKPTVPTQEKCLVLIHDVQRDPLTEKPIHVDFYQPSLEKEIEASIPIILEGIPPAVKDLGGTLIKNMLEIEVKALPQNLPREIKINIENLKTFEDHILIKDLKIEEGVKILKNPEEIVVSVAPPEKVEEELAKPVEEKIEEVKIVEKEKKKEEVKEEAAPKGGEPPAKGEARSEERRPEESGRDRKE